MKFIYKILLVVLVTSLTLTSCDMFKMDLQDDPNEVTSERASLNDLYNNIQLTFGRQIFEGAQRVPGRLARMYHAGGSFDYESLTSPTTFNGLWFAAYSTLFPDIDALLVLAEERGLDIHAGSAKIMKAYTLIALVDLFGNVPLSDAGQGTDVISPSADDGTSVYAAAVVLLDEAIAQMNSTLAAAPTSDLFYGGSAAKWVTFAKTLKLRVAITTRLTNGNAANEINSLVNAGDLIDEASEDFQFNYGNQRTNPNSRHPFYQTHYEVGDGVYLSNYYMWKLRADKIDADGVIQIDPRIRFYFRRKVDDAVNQDQTTFGCNFSAFPDQAFQPPHYAEIDPRLPYCIAWEDGYTGRDHLNGQGIPPDGPIRTSFGLYPGGGSFDYDQFTDTRQQGTTGGLGQGIHPIMMSSFVDFMRAEAALMLGTSDDARALLESGMRKSIAKVFSFASLVPGEMNTLIDSRVGTGPVSEVFVPDADEIDKYIAFVMDQYDNAASQEDKLNVLMTEYYLALWGNGLEAYNMYRRTGKPDNMAPGLDPAYGTFIRTFFYPDVYVNRNANAIQKELTVPVFWDNESIDLY